MVIIALVSTFVLRALAAVRDSSKSSKTRATIAKINKVIMAQWESYQTRRVPIDAVQLAVKMFGLSNYPTPTQVAIARLNALRDLIRMEMPDRWSDVTSSFSNFASPCCSSPPPTTRTLRRPVTVSTPASRPIPGWATTRL